MLLLYAKYAILFSMIVGDKQDDTPLMRQLFEDKELLGVAACSKRCLQQFQSAEPQKTHPFVDCFHSCKVDGFAANGTAHTPPPLVVRRVQENFQLKLVCRTEKSLTFRIDWVVHSWNKTLANHSQAAPDALYIVHLHTPQRPDNESITYLSDEDFFTIENLQADTAYKISALAVHSSGNYSNIANQVTFNTLKARYLPGKLSDGSVRLLNFSSQPGNPRRLSATIEWEPSANDNCFYDIIYYSTDSKNLGVATPLHIRNPSQLFQQTIPDFELAQKYRLGLHTVNPKHNGESPFQWIEFQTPSCLEWFHFNYTICAPLMPANLQVQQQRLTDGHLSLNVSWSLPKYEPDFYALHVLDLHNEGEDLQFNVSKTASSFFIPRIRILGTSFEVHLAAYSQGGENATYLIVDKEAHHTWMEASDLNKLLLFIIGPVGCIVILSIFTVWKRKAKLKRYRQRCIYLKVRRSHLANCCASSTFIPVSEG